jgi:hypothetical protein
MKIVTPHTHAVDGLLEAMFHVILRESKIDADVTANVNLNMRGGLTKIDACHRYGACYLKVIQRVCCDCTIRCRRSACVAT